MAVLDDEIDTCLSLAEGGAGVWSPLRAASQRQSQNLRAQYEGARAKAEEARCEELRQAGMEARSRAGSLKRQIDKCQAKLKAARIAGGRSAPMRISEGCGCMTFGIPQPARRSWRAKVCR